MSRSASGLLFVAGVTFGGATCTTPDPYPDGLYAEIETPKGQIVLRLDSERTPMTVASFVGLAEGTVENDAFEEGEPFFDGSSFHRVVPGHVIQGGRPDSDMSDSSGHALPNEIHPELGHGRAGMLGMANGGPHTRDESVLHHARGSLLPRRQLHGVWRSLRRYGRRSGHRKG